MTLTCVGIYLYGRFPWYSSCLLPVVPVKVDFALDADLDEI